MTKGLDPQWVKKRIEHWVRKILEHGRPLKGPQGTVLTDKKGKPIYGPPSAAELGKCMQWLKENDKGLSGSDQTTTNQIRERAMQAVLQPDNPDDEAE